MQDSLPPVSAQGVSFFALRRGKALDNREIDDKTILYIKIIVTFPVYPHPFPIDRLCSLIPSNLI